MSRQEPADAQVPPFGRMTAADILRHRFASFAGDLGLQRTYYCRLIGQMRRAITSRYVHTADAVLFATADAFRPHGKARGRAAADRNRRGMGKLGVWRCLPAMN
jgi:hypothetical protein